MIRKLFSVLAQGGKNDWSYMAMSWALMTQRIDIYDIYLFKLE